MPSDAFRPGCESELSVAWVERGSWGGYLGNKAQELKIAKNHDVSCGHTNPIPGGLVPKKPVQS